VVSLQGKPAHQISQKLFGYAMNYAVKESQLTMLGCIATSENQEDDSFQTLNICKNLTKIKLQKLPFSRFRDRADECDS
jgi:hypothetical protein